MAAGGFRTAPLACELGQRMLQEAAAAGRTEGRHCGALRAAWQRQEGNTMCGVRSLCIVTGALRPGAAAGSEDGLLRQRRGAQGPSVEKIADRGMTLPELHELAVDMPFVASANSLHCHPHGPLASVDDMRRELLAGLSAGDAVIVNYHMSTLGQVPWRGHFSPVSSYHPGSDAFLILDTWMHTEPLWAAAGALWEAVSTTDAESERTRGILRLTLQEAAAY
eukprot:TRINITY_DN26172_c0_g1_i1.p1 TRINITY_DN26172_c0_g1~~TRINITY_DN26172_c0_g1_i1.p1  ORF type:complete len:248 (+),score=52.85 TRINITY_DN26172_c0_g1_i1:81-746(+)